MCVVIEVDVKLITEDVVQDFVAVLEVIEHTQNGAVVVVGSQRRHADVLQGHLRSIKVGLYLLNSGLEIQNLGEGRKEGG